MALPFTTAQFFEVFRLYNDALWPSQIIGYCLAVAALTLLLRGYRFADKIISAFLTVAWIWTGALYHIIYFSRINKAAIVFGIVFIVQGIAFLWYGLIKNRIELRLKRDISRVLAFIVIIYAMIGYPAAAYLLGQLYPRVPVFPIAPCPLTIFTLGILLLSIEKAPISAWIIPLLWSIIGFTAALKLSIYEDYGLFLSGVLSVITLLLTKPKHSALSIRK